MTITTRARSTPRPERNMLHFDPFLLRLFCSFVLLLLLMVCLPLRDAWADKWDPVTLGTANGTEIVLDRDKPYYKNGESKATNDPTNYNAYYDAGASTLTLRELKVDGYYEHDSESCYALFVSSDVTKLVLLGESRVTCISPAFELKNAAGFQAGSALTIEGTGTLIAQGVAVSKAGGASSGLSFAAGVTINGDCHLIGYAEGANNSNSYGINLSWAESTVILNSGTLEGHGKGGQNSYGICITGNEKSTVKLTGSTLIGNAGSGTVSSGGIALGRTDDVGAGYKVWNGNTMDDALEHEPQVVAAKSYAGPVTLIAKACTLTMDGGSVQPNQTSFPVGTKVTITADPSASAFRRWKVAPEGAATFENETGSPTTLQFNQPTALTVTSFYAPTDVTLDVKKLELKTGEEGAFIIFSLKPAGRVANTNVEWSVSPEGVVSVSMDPGGRLKVVPLKGGTATITVKAVDSPPANPVFATCSVTVTQTPTSVTVKPAELTLKEGQSSTLTATVLPKGVDQTVTWTSSDEKVATVDKTGVVSAKAPGVAQITATSTNGKTGSCQVTVPVPVKGVKIDTEQLDLDMGKGGKLTVTIEPDNATNKNVSWKIDPPGVATVDQNGNVTAVGPGVAVITVTTEDGDYTATCKIAVTGVVVGPTSLKLAAGQKGRVSATFYPTDASIAWSSTDESVVTVDQNGNVTAIGLGEAEITAFMQDGKYRAVCDVEVSSPPSPPPKTGDNTPLGAWLALCALALLGATVGMLRLRGRRS